MTPSNTPFFFGKDTLTPGIALDIARGKLRGEIDRQTAERITASREAVDIIVERGDIVYGINTGFGSLCTTVISREQTRKLQDNLLRSHSVGVGYPIPNEIARLMLVLKIQSLAQGYSGIRPQTIERILWHLEKDIIPVVPSQGSLGASGDLAPLAHLFLPLIGLGEVRHKGEVLPGAEILQRFQLPPLELGPKEGLALINGTQFIAAYAVRVLERMHNCLDCADIIGAMSLEALLGTAKPFAKALHRLRPYTGSLHVAHRLRHLLDESEMVKSHANCGRVQDPYSLRCMPQVHGASRNTWLHLKELLQIELNAVTDNPIILDADNAISGGNFHGQPLALPLDYATLAASEIGNISDRRSYLLLEGGNGLPVLLMRNTGINSGFMIPQYTSAALASENKGLCFPASADSIPTSLGQEDHVSMGSISGRKAYKVLENLENILAVELLCAAQAFDFRRPLKSSLILEACHSIIRKRIDHAEEDRVFGEDIAVTHHIITSGELARTATETAIEEKINLKGDYDDRFGLY